MDGFVGTLSVKAIAVTDDDIVAGRMRFELAVDGVPIPAAMRNRAGKRMLRGLQAQMAKQLQAAMAEGE